MQTESSGETWRWKQRDDALEVLQVRDVFFDIIETISGVICCSEGEIEATGQVIVEARLPQEASPRVGFRMKTPNDGKVRDIGVH